MRSKFNVTGLASAATIWALGSLGVLIGSGHMLLALLAALIMFFNCDSYRSSSTPSFTGATVCTLELWYDTKTFTRCCSS